MTHFMYCPWTGLGLYNGFRGNRWLANRIIIFKQFVIPSLQAQSNKDFVLWCSWRREERNNPHVLELQKYLETTGLKTVHTFAGVCFWDDKYKDEVARERFIMAVHNSIPDLYDVMEGDTILMTIQPSDDCYHSDFVRNVQATFTAQPELQAVGFRKGYIMNYQTMQVSEYNPLTIPPFFTIKFPRKVFTDPRAHVEYASYKSHEYIAEKLKFGQFEERGFLVGTHGENISTTYKHPFRGEVVPGVLVNFGLDNVEPLKIKPNYRRMLLHRLPHRVQRKIRYIFGEKLFGRV